MLQSHLVVFNNMPILLRLLHHPTHNTMPIGPQLPPHLAGNRAATPSDDEDDGFGPALPPDLAAKRNAQRDIGPQRPPTTHEDDDEDDIGPRVAGPSVGPSRPPVGPSRPAVGPSRPPVGPSPPPTSSSSRYAPARPPAPDSDSDDDFVGPRPDAAPTGPQLSAAEAFRAREARWAQERAEAAAAAARGPTKREDWMLVPPTSGSLSHIDPLKRPTSFQKSSRAAVTADEQKGWTESPADKARRLADEVAGVKRAPERGSVDDELERKRRRMRDEEIRDTVDKHNVGRCGGIAGVEGKDTGVALTVFAEKRSRWLPARPACDQEEQGRGQGGAGVLGPLGAHGRYGAAAY